MAQVKFYLEKRKDASGNLIIEDVPVFLYFSFAGKRLQYYTGVRVNQSNWDAENMQVHKHADAKRHNSTLSRLKRWVEEIDDRAKALGQSLTLDEFRYQLKEKSGTTTERKSGKTFREYFEEYIDSSRLTKKAATVKGINTVFNILKEFSVKTRTGLEFDNVNQEFYNKLLDFCFHTKEYKNNNTGRVIKTLKSFLNWSTEHGYNKNLEYKKKGFKKLQEQPEIIFLTYDELMRLFKVKLESEKHKRVRDAFCFGCFTGMRFSDLCGLTRENIHKNSIVYRIKKTDDVNTIPMNSYMRAILNRYKKEDKPLPMISEQKTNTYLKELAVLVELNRKIKITHFRGGERIETIAPLHELITFHVSKKTFMTNFLARGGSLETAMAITGNKDYKTAKRYFKVVDSLKVDEMQRVFGK